MNRFLTLLAAALLLVACHKNEFPSSLPGAYVQGVSAALKDSLPAEQYAALDFGHAVQTHIDSAHLHFLRIPFTGKDIAKDFIIVQTDAAGHIQRGQQISIEPSATSAGTSSFNGQISYHSLSGKTLSSMAVVNGHIQKNITARKAISTMVMAAEDPAMDGGDLPDVIVYASYSDGGISWGDWYNLLAMINAGGGGYGGGSYYVSSGGGGSSSSPAVHIDFDSPESKDAIDVKKYINCFGTIPDAGATFTITIATDIPVDGDPSQFFNWNEATPGHTYIELYKLNNTGLVSQNIGFYPNTPWKTATGGNIASKIADDAGHEYNARYTISLSASQFQAALNAVQTYSARDYNIAGFNCTDFALAVFNAAGGNLNIPKYEIPGFNTPGGSNTPQGVYNQLQSMEAAGTPNIQSNANKAYGGGSHGPCN